MSLHCVLIFEGVFSFPRVSGDEPVRVTVDAESEAFSPRERG